MRPRLLLLGGLDPSGGAGLTVDAMVAERLGVAALPVCVVLTAQSRRGFAGCSPVPVALWQAAARLLLADAPVQAIKVGLVGDANVVREIAAFVAEFVPDVPLVVDPVLGATTGGFVASAELLDAYRDALLPLATLCTPNLPELHALFDGEPAKALSLGCSAVLCKGGHGEGAQVVDALFSATGRQEWRRERFDIGEVRGTGCSLASAIAAHLANGSPLSNACATAVAQLAQVLAAMGPAAADRLPRCLPLAEWPTSAS